MNSALTKYFGENFANKANLAVMEKDGVYRSSRQLNKSELKQIMKGNNITSTKDQKLGIKMYKGLASEKMYEIGGYVGSQPSTTTQSGSVAIKESSGTENQNTITFERNYTGSGNSYEAIQSTIQNCETNGSNWGLIPYENAAGFDFNYYHEGTIILDVTTDANQDPNSSRKTSNGEGKLIEAINEIIED